MTTEEVVRKVLIDEHADVLRESLKLHVRELMVRPTPAQTRGNSDALRKHLSHTSSALFACPPGTRPGGYLGERLFAPT